MSMTPQALAAGMNPLGAGSATNPQYLPVDFLQQLLGPLVANQQAGLGMQQALLSSQLSDARATTAMQQRSAGQEAGWGLRGLDLQRTTGVDIPTAQMGISRGLADQMWGFTQQASPLQRQLQVDLPTAAAQRAQGLEQSQYGLTQQGQALSHQELGISGQELGQQQEQLDYNATRALQNALGSQAARGASSTVGAGRELEDLAKQKGWSQADLARAKERLGISGSREGIAEQQSALSHTDTQAGLEQQLKQLGIGGQLYDLGQQEAGAQHEAANKQYGLQQQGIDATAKGLGLSREELTGRLTNQMGQLGLSGDMSINQIFSDLASSTMGQFSPTASQTNQIAQLATGKIGLPAGVTVDQLKAMLGGGAPPAAAPAPAPAAAPRPAAPAPKPIAATAPVPKPSPAAGQARRGF
jgi:hypothetical protein